MASAWGLALRIPPVAAKQHQGPASLGDRACQVVTRPLGSSGGLDKKKMPSNKADTAKQQIDQYVFEVCKSAWKNCCYSSLIGVTATILAECIHQVSRVVWRN